MTESLIRGFTHVSLSVANLGRSRHFYHDILGLPVLADTFDGAAFDGREVMLVVGRSALCLQEHRRNDGAPFDPARRGLDHVAFAVPSLESLGRCAKCLTAAGIEHSGVKPLQGFGWIIELRDPDGIQLELHCMDSAPG